jgi:putative OPT family oligopeptide transporter
MAIQEKIPPQEYPDVVGAVPENPLAAAFRPFIPASVVLPELTILPLIVGTLLGMVFGASSLYLVLKVGLTVSASIPVAVISITFFRLLAKLGRRHATILENNIVQTAGSAGESIAFGVGVTMPAIMILGFDLEITRVMLVAILGGLLGILMMIPLRRALIVQQHGLLKYPEGTACAEVLKAGATDEERVIAARYAAEGAAAAGEEAPAAVEATYSGAKTIFAGFGIGALYKAAMQAFKLWKEVPQKIFGAPFTAGSISAEISPELLGVGYIIGPRIASIMCAGGVLAYLVLIPAIKYFGGVATGVIAPGTIPISQMGPDEIRGAYVLYIGAGAVAAGGIISLVRSLPTIWHGLKGGLADLKGKRDAAAVAASSRPRTDQDLSFKLVIVGIVALMVLIMVFRTLHMNFFGALLIVLFGFLFVTVSSRLTGEIGSSSNPISGMTVATLLLTCLAFLALGWTGPIYYVTALSVGAIVCIASSNGGTTSQDLKTGFLVGATPRAQQIAILVGALASALVLGPLLLGLNEGSTVYVPLTDKASGQIVAQGYAPDLHADVSQLTATTQLKGPQGKSDSATYHVWHKTDEVGGPAGKYLVDDRGVPVYLADPGINGVHRTRPDGSTVTKFDAPKATLMSYIIKGILNRQLPWGLVLLGVMIAIVLEMSGIPSLAFAVGVYLPLSSSSPIFIGGAIRWLVDRFLRKKLAGRNLTEEELTAEGDKSPGVLMASGYIAGGAIAGTIYAFLNLLPRFTSFTRWADDTMAHNPVFAGDYSDALTVIPFLVLCLLLYLAGREAILAGKKAR